MPAFKGKFCNAEVQFLTSLPKSDMVIIGRNWNARADHDAHDSTSSIGGRAVVKNFFAVPKNFLLLLFPASRKSHLYEINISDISGTADKYSSQIKECLRKSIISTVGYASRKYANWVLKITVQLSEKSAKARMSGNFEYRML